MLSVLERLKTLLSTLDTVFPSTGAVKEPTFPMKNIINDSYSVDLQPFAHLEDIKASFEIGRSYTFGYLAPLLLASTFKVCTAIDFKAYSVSILGQSNILSPYRRENDTRQIQKEISSWINLCGIPDSDPNKTFRRCIVVFFTSEFSNMKGESVHTSGHAITLAFEIKKQVLTLKIIEYRMHEYVYNVHDQLFQWMRDSLPLHDWIREIRTETVCLKGKMKVDEGFMTCMSVAYRVCLYLSIDRDDCDIIESDEDFVNDSYALKYHIFRMIRWAISSKSKITVLIPKTMRTLFEINNENCYLFTPEAKKKLRFSLIDGLEEYE
jgi:hypothetical protein